MSKKNFTAADESRYNVIGAANKGKRPYTRADPANPPEEYRFTVRMPAEYGTFMSELAYRERSTITAEFQRLVKEEIERRPDILEYIDELNKKL